MRVSHGTKELKLLMQRSGWWSLVLPRNHVFFSFFFFFGGSVSLCTDLYLSFSSCLPLQIFLSFSFCFSAYFLSTLQRLWRHCLKGGGALQNIYEIIVSFFLSILAIKLAPPTWLCLTLLPSEYNIEIMIVQLPNCALLLSQKLNLQTQLRNSRRNH